MLIRYIKILLSLSVSAWGLIAGSINLIYYNHRGVSAVMGMQGADSIRAIDHPILLAIGYAFIYLLKLLTGVVCAWGSYKLWNARTLAADEFNKAKTTSIAGCGIALFMLFFGFIVLAGSYFSSGNFTNLQLTFHQYATFYIVGIGMISLYISIDDRDL